MSKKTVKQAAEHLISGLTEEDVEPVHGPLITQLRGALQRERKTRRDSAVARWDKMTPEERRIQTAAAVAASPINKAKREAK